ncbi:MAG: TIGR02186 family protein [Paracoccus sp. (in: a-proteobacteria)]|uniref:TIGR02186 family protein n=1 Tax=Paracoccus sp. TaxID=267 RepID=UPI0026E10517|nr:TIGR02186 family protein [Paracoccus sp. (in: a-proteobacteria)]MDO5632434.1 TIGR02186 family protein [Paracoccus sp. (in: a-proteobacteria)]
MRAFVLAALLFALPVAAAAQQPDDTYPTYRDFGRPADEPGVPPPQEEVVAGLSSDAVAITASFDGSDILIYGAVKRETPIPPGPPLQVIVTVEGPGQVLTIRRKSRKLGIWLNTESLHVGAVPSFYVVTTSAPLSQILLPEYDTRYRISVPLAMRAFAGPVQVEDTVPFTEALVRQRQQDGIYRLDEGDVHIAEQTLFRADVRLPANLIEGEYRTRIFLLRDGRIIDVYRAPIEVRKVGLERWLYRMAFDQPLLYGLMSLAVAVIAGWGASAAFRLVRRS